MTCYLKTLVALVVALMAAAGNSQDALSQTREAGEVFRDCPHCPLMVVVPPGEFMMGLPPSEEWRNYAESPRHRVTIGSPFAVGVYEVTFTEWDECAVAGGCVMAGPYDDEAGSPYDDAGDSPYGDPSYRRRPVVNVSWDDAQSYVGWLSLETGESYRLLSESEWEYAARAGTETRYWWGNDIGRNRANCWECGSRWDEDDMAPVGSFAANGFGLHDVHGNVWEWVQDCWNGNYIGAPNDGSAWEDWERERDCSHRVARGGSWFDYPQHLRATVRGLVDPGSRRRVLGFRVARTLVP